MARKKKNEASGLSLLLFAGFIAWAGWPSDLSRTITGFAIIAGLWVIVASVINFINYKRASKRVDNEIEKIVENNIDALMRRRAQLLQPDAYGNLKTDKWTKEIGYFISTNLLWRLGDYDRSVAVERASELSDYIERIVSTKTSLKPPHQAFRDDMTPTDYEHFCAEELKRSGWDTRVTMASRDQGVDVVAQKSGIRIAVQCKLYRTPVGNKAVQEVAAARAHEMADFAIVVSNNSYTPAAEELAKTNNVFLLHHRDLAKIDDILSLSPTIPSDSSQDATSELASSFSYRSFQEAVRPAHNWRRLSYGALTLVLIVMAVSLLARDPQSNSGSAVVQTQNEKEKRASQATADAPAALHSVSSANDLATSPHVGSEPSKSSPPDATAGNSGSVATVENSTPATSFENSSDNVAVNDPIAGGAEPSSQRRAPAIPAAEVDGSTLAFRCRPVTAGSTTAIAISISGGNWEVSHVTKKGTRIERAAQYYVLDTSGGQELSWQGVHRRNRELKMVAHLSQSAAGRSFVYKEEVFDANTGKVAETTAICEELPTAHNGPRSR